MTQIRKKRDDRLAEETAPSAPVAYERVLRLPQVCKLTGLGRSLIYQMQAENRFPRRIKIGVRAVGWLEDEVQGRLAKRIESSRQQTPNRD
jgi:prophage regulatory protein